MFLNVLGVTNWRVNTVCEQSDVCVSVDVVKPRNPRPSKGFAWADSDQDFLASFFRDIAKAPSHYCRSDSKKIYLDVVFKTMDKLYEVYATKCKEAGKQPFTLWKLSDYFEKNNFSLFQRKKDKCNTCMSYDVGLVSLEEFTAHQKNKNEGFDSKGKGKEVADNQTSFVATADTEALLTAPLNESNIMFFRTKLNLHNLTYKIYNKDVKNSF